MEFLVRLQDKINTQVFCFNPSHKGLKMDRVSFKDDTFEAACPDCRSGVYLYRKNNVISKKGHFVTFKPDGWNWGTNELKYYGITEIDCTYEQAKQWCQTIENEQARVDARDYREQANVQRGLLLKAIQDVNPIPEPPASAEEIIAVLTTIKLTLRETLESDQEYLLLRDNECQAENRASIDYRYRKMAFDFEKALTADQLENWNDMNQDSEIIAIPENDKAQIKEIQWP